jgi:uncharacterized protein
MREFVLSFLEARALGCLIEKEATTPDSYPLSLNALVGACNQKTNRHPVIAVTESEVQNAVDGLLRHTLVIASSGGRVPRYEHNGMRGLQVDAAGMAALAVLILRGPQTGAEVRMNVDRLHKFADIAAVETTLEDLATRPGRAYVRKLERAPGMREARYVHLLCGEPDPSALKVEVAGPVAAAGVGVSEIAALKANVASLRDEVATLREAVRSLQSELGVQ